MKSLLSLDLRRARAGRARLPVRAEDRRSFLVFAAVIGFTYLSTVPPTVGLVAKFFGPRYMATLFGVVMLSHQVGGFLGAWLGGKAFEATGAYDWMWYADIVLAVAAAGAPADPRGAARAARRRGGLSPARASRSRRRSPAVRRAASPCGP